ncbi:hypothetical protein [Coleofasciculus sp. FACHB-T130]|uniref:hypothetical protein n=1 Tax=Cyanophyceae TaxID=3028117 RepID=UPI0016853028|nr:hypothetical protein [Coleofasciculus sp. FACHB-T130]MBD1878311.1 hypothetical protein [Coleofasciculus sp. FACHB-T130]
MKYKQSFILLIFVQLLYFTPVFLKGEVIFPHNNNYEVVGSNLIVENTYISNRKFSDQSSVYIPEINQHLNGNHHSWLSTWNPYVELGRPTFQLSGFSRAYLITNMLSIFTKNPFILYTALTVITVCLTGIFLFLFLKALDLHPLACSIAAIGLSLGIFVSYWLTFIMFISTICWSVCLLWLNTEFIKKPSFLSAIGISFATYSILMTGYPQFIVLSAYILVSYTIVRLCKYTINVKNKFYTALMILGLVVSGVLMASPTYADLLINSQRSARLNGVSDDFFLAVLPKINNFRDLGIFFTSIFDPFWLGNPIDPNYPVTFNGLSLNPFYFTLFLFSFLNKQWCNLWPWQLFSILCLIGTIWPPAYLFAVHHLGFNLSRSQLLGGAIIPGFILCGYAIDNLVRNKLVKPRYLIAWSLVPLTALSALQLVFWYKHYDYLNLKFIAASWIIIMTLALFIAVNKAFLLQCLVVISIFIYGQSLMLVRPLDNIQTSSPLISLIKKETSDGSRFALVGNEIVGIVPSNQEALFQIKSIHSYNSLSSKDYQKIVLNWSQSGTNTYGRNFNKLDSESKISNSDFSLSGVSLLMSKTPLTSQNFIKIAELNEIKVYKKSQQPILLSQTPNYSIDNGNQVSLKSSVEEKFPLKIQEHILFDDFKKIEVTPLEQETLLFLSQQYHPQWRANSKDIPLKTVMVNGFYQGVIIPPGINEVDLAFLPYVLWSWLPQLIYAILGCVLLIIWFVKCTSRFGTLPQ